MGWETRRGRLYYYEKVREGGRVVSRFVGVGVLGEISARYAQLQRMERERKRAAIRAERVEMDLLAGEVAEVCEGINVVMRAFLVVAGYHQHDRGQWRKRRKGVSGGEK